MPFNLTLTHSHTLLVTLYCCYDQIKGTQDKDFSYSFSDSFSDSLSHYSYALPILVLDSLSLLMPILSMTLSHYLIVSPSPTASDSLSLPHTHTLTITCTGCYDEIKATRDLKNSSHAAAQILSHCITAHSLCDAFVAGGTALPEIAPAALQRVVE